MSKIKDAKRANFELKKFKIKDNKVITDYAYLHDENPDKEKRIYPGVKIPLQPHPDMIELYNSLREYLLKEYYIEASPENINQVTITSISLSGEDENHGVIISGVLNSLHGGKIAMNTARIVFSRDETGLEGEVDAIVDSIVSEAFDYLFKGKRADPTLFCEPEMETPEPTEKPASGLNVTLQKVG